MVASRLLAVVDDDEPVRESLADLLRELGFEASAFPSAEEFLASTCPASVRCLLLDIAMPGMSGPELQRELIRRGYTIPIIFITAVADKRIASALLRDGAVACLSKPFSEQELREALAAAFPGA
jgi:FixJ family two-component response regulator